MGTKFELFVKTKGKAKDQTLPCTHTCEAIDFFNIIDSMQLEPQHCEVFGERILYMFYGRASYQLNLLDRNPESQAYLPVCIIFKPETKISHKRLSPFDTGAWHKGLFSGIVHHKMDKEDFELDNFDSVKRVVDVFFEDNGGYCSGKIKKGLEIQAAYLHAQAYYTIISDLQGKADNRRRTIEIQTADPIKLKSECIELVIIPDYWLNETDTKQLLDNAFSKETRIETYKCTDLNPNLYIGQINQILMHYLELNDYLK